MEDTQPQPSPSPAASPATAAITSPMRKASEDLDNEWDKVSDAPIPEHGALQIVSIGNETNEYAFQFHEEKLDSIMKKVPDDYKVCVVSVVGAFRTGKSFLLSWFLRYLDHTFSRQPAAPEAEDGEETAAADSDASMKWHEKEGASLGNDGFGWRGGAERNTTGIWMWSQPFFVPSGADKDDKIALLLVDTQGMFDHETTMGLTAAIFGLSTLLSSYQIYNVDKRIQEDNLQQLALFSEYGRMALHSDKNDAAKHPQQKKDSATSAAKSKDGEDDKDEANPQEPKISLNPFQKIEFLGRWRICVLSMF